jgi:hypothetical protein
MTFSVRTIFDRRSKMVLTIIAPLDIFHHPLLLNVEIGVRFDVFTAVTMKNAVFWDTMPPCDFCVYRVSEEHIASIFRVKRP